MKNVFYRGAISMFFATAIVGCSNVVNTNRDEHFDEYGYLIKDSLDVPFQLKQPSQVKFYVEVSGSMNGFFRANKPTEFKADLWNIVSYLSEIVPEVTILTNDGNQGATYPLSSFQTMMNTGSFVSTASTKVPVMLQAIMSRLDASSDEVAVLVSDMKYSPVGAAAPEVLMTQYSTDISKILGQYGYAVSLVCATSNYLDKNGNDLTDRSPYYYLIMGKAQCVAQLRNTLSTLLQMREHYVDNIESGFDFGRASYSFGITNKCDQLESEPTFCAYEEASSEDTCTIHLKVDLENYRWIMTDETVFRNALMTSVKYGSQLTIGDIQIDVANITGEDKQLNRKAVANVELKLSNMATDSEVIEWNLELPQTNYTLMSEFFEDATDENDPTKSYSLLDFVKGIFHGGLINKDLKPNYILVSKKD